MARLVCDAAMARGTAAMKSVEVVERGDAVDRVTFETFAQARAEGFDKIMERQWAARTILEPHTRPVALRVRVVQGEMWLTVGG